MKDHIVEIKDVSKIFVTNSGSLELFTDVNINFYPSTSYALIGESGVGKSTLLHIASGLEKPSSGEVFFGRQNFWDLKASHQALLRLNETAIIFQQYNLIPCLSVKENIEFQSRINKKHNNEYIKAIIDDLQITRLLEEWPENLSGGEQQMLAIGRALMSKPKVLLLDEPSLGIAPKLVNQIFVSIKNINKEKNVTIFLVEQNAKKALELADRAYVLVNGKVTIKGPGQELLKNKDIQAAYLEGGAKN